MVYRIFENQLSGWSEAGGAHLAFEWATAFKVDVACYLHELRWLRTSTGTAHKPTILRLWDTTTQAVVSTAATIPDNGAVGWQTHTVTSEVALVPDREYRVADARQAGSLWGWKSGSVTGQPSIFTMPSTVRYSSPQGTHQYPNNGDATTYQSIDVGVDFDSPTAAQPVTEAQLQNALSSWMHETDAPPLRPYSLPVVIRGIADAIEAKVDALGTDVDLVQQQMAVPAGQTLWAMLGTLATQVGVGVAITTITDHINSLFGAPGAPDELGVSIENANSQLTLEAGRRNIAIGDPGWLLQATLVGTGKVVWDEPADAYVLTRTAWDADRQVNVYEGHTYFFDRGWWAPSQDGLIDGYGTLASEKHILRVGDRRMQGVLIVQDDDFEWTLEAYFYVGSGT